MKIEKYKTKLHFIILYSIIFISTIIIIILNRNMLLENKTKILKNMDESTQVNDLQKSIDDLNASQTVYSNYINTSKTNLAQAITNAGVPTSETDSFETMTNNISNIVSTKTNDATATAAQILTGQTAYVKGSKVTGTMANRGALNWNPSSSTSYSVPAGYYSGGTISTSNAWNAGVVAADNRANANSTNYKTGYNAGYAAGQTAGFTGVCSAIGWQTKTLQPGYYYGFAAAYSSGTSVRAFLDIGSNSWEANTTDGGDVKTFNFTLTQPTTVSAYSSKSTSAANRSSIASAGCFKIQ